MSIRYFVSALTIYAFMGSVQTRAQESLVTYKSLTPEIALDLARAALADCQKRGYQVAVAVVDRNNPPGMVVFLGSGHAYLQCLFLAARTGSAFDP